MAISPRADQGPNTPPHSVVAVRDGYILVKLTGQITRERAAELNRKAHALGMEVGIHNYLVDATNARNVDSTADNYQFAYSDMRSEGVDRRAHVSLLVSPNDHSHDFVELVAKNAGLDVTLFRDRRAAMRHLLARTRRVQSR